MRMPGLDSSKEAAWAITTWRTRHGHPNRKFWLFAVFGTRHVHFSLISELRLFNAHRPLIFEIARTLKFDPKKK
jgi:hypothetical protein